MPERLPPSADSDKEQPTPPQTYQFEPEKDPEDYGEFVNLRGELELYDIDEITEKDRHWWGRPMTERGDELLALLEGGRWLLVYMIDDINQERTAQSRAMEPIDRELSPAESARWFLINWRRLPKGLRPLPAAADLPGKEVKTRLDHDWRPPDRSTSEEGTPTVYTPSEHPSRTSEPTPTAGAEGREPTKARSRKKRDGGKAHKVKDYMQLFIEACFEARENGNPIPPLETQAQLAKRLKVSEATVSRSGRKYFDIYISSFALKIPHGKKKDDRSLEANDFTDPTDF